MSSPHIFLSTNQKEVPLTTGSFVVTFFCYTLALMAVISVHLLIVMCGMQYAF